MSIDWLNTISPTELFRLMQTGGPLNVIDVRTPAEFATVHAEGARLLPLASLDAAAAARHDGTIYVLCHSGQRAATAARQLQRVGSRDVTVVQGGTVAWEQAGLPVVRGVASGTSHERQIRIGMAVLILLAALLAWWKR